ncbi:MAG: hypothetical protein K0Q99_2041, partial [Clostridia bacterium]|nr:hypothetical protein [Clostridia bacterium]
QKSKIAPGEGLLNDYLPIWGILSFVKSNNSIVKLMKNIHRTLF